MDRETFRADDKRRFFQLYLLSFIRVSPLILSRSLQQLNSTKAELESIKGSMKGRGYERIGGPTVQFYRELLGQPVSEDAIDNKTVPEAFHNSKALRFELSLWPDFDLVVNELPDGRTFNTCFKRSKIVLVPALTDFKDLEPWRFVREEVDASFGPPQFGDAWDNWEELDYMIPESPGATAQRCSLLFDFNLLQSANYVPVNKVDTLAST